MSGSRMRVSVGGVLMSFVLAMVVGVSGVIAPGGVAALGASTTLTIIGGDVQVSRQGAPFEVASDGAVLTPGDVIRTADNGRAVLTYFEGSTVSIDPSSELAIDLASASPDGSTVVVMTQNLGRTWHVVTKLIGGGSRYEVRTPAATASVRGTAFEVGVARHSDGEITTSITTTEGAVAAAASGSGAEPEPVVVAAGFQATTRASDRRAGTPTLAPEPERKVTVTVGSESSLVVDPFGRANGFKDGRLVLQTPGAQVARSGGALTVTLPDVPDGKLATVLGQGNASDVRVVTTVAERGKAPATVSEVIAGAATVSGVEVRRGAAGPEATPSVRTLDQAERDELPAPKSVHDGEDASGKGPRPGLGPDPKVLQAIAEERRPATSGGGATGPSEERFVPQLLFQGAPNAASQQRADERAEAEAKKIEAEIRTRTQLQKAAEAAEQAATVAQSRANEEAKKAEAARARAEQAAREAEAARLRAERERRAAEEQAARAATDAARRAAEAEAQRQAAEQQRAEQARLAADADRRRAALEAAERAAQQERARQAEQAARELRERLERESEKHQKSSAQKAR